MTRIQHTVVFRLVHPAGSAAEAAFLDTARRDAAGDPRSRRLRDHSLETEAYAWVHATLIEATVRAYREFVAPMSDAQAEAFYADWMPLGRLLGVRERDLPETWVEFSDYFRTMCDERLERNETVEAVIRTLSGAQAAADPVIRGMWPLLRLAPARAVRLSTVGLLNDPLRARFGLALDARRCAPVPDHGPRPPRDDSTTAQASASASGRRHLRWRAAGDRRRTARAGSRRSLVRRSRSGRGWRRSERRRAALAGARRGPGGREAGDEIAARILDAALTEGAAKGLERITMDAVAVRARVGRMTVYRRFGGRDGLVGRADGP